MLKTINLKKVYPNGEEALKGINLEIPNGQVVALIGPSGAGKSTFIRTCLLYTSDADDDLL